MRKLPCLLLAVLSVPVLGPLGDVMADMLLGLVTRDKFSLCPLPEPSKTSVKIQLDLRDITNIFGFMSSYFR